MKKKWLPFLTLILLIIGFLSFYYGELLIHPNSYLFDASGDGIKNYYTYSYLISNNPGILNFEGMNYPYGEHVLFTDCHPFLASLLKGLNFYFPIVSENQVGILNVIMILSIGLTAIIIYLVLKILAIRSWLAVLGALSITILSPQLFRLTGHYALSYSFCIPLVIYGILYYEKYNNPIKTASLLGTVILFFFFTHAYLGMIATTLMCAYIFVSFVLNFKKDKKEFFKKNLALILCAILPILVFVSVAKLTDNHVGRTTNPWGILENHADLNSVFLPSSPGPINSLKEFVAPNMEQTPEGRSYIGFTTTVLLLFSVCILIVRLIQQKKFKLPNYISKNKSLYYLFIVSLLFLIFALFIPFKFHPRLERLINYFDIIKQFRAIGRFAWVFYFVSTLVLCFFANEIFDRLKSKKKLIWAYSLSFLLPFSLLCEGIMAHNKMAITIQSKSNYFDLGQCSTTFQKDIESIDPSNYQAILPFPFFYIGSDNFGVESEMQIYEHSFLYSYHLNLPFIGSFLTRTSIPESKNSMQLLASNFYPKKIQLDFPSQKPLLVIALNNDLSEIENNYLSEAKVLIKHTKYSIYEISVQTFFENNAKKHYTKFLEKSDHLIHKDGFLVSDSSLYFHFADFKKDTKHSFSKKNGSLCGLQNEFQILYTVDNSKIKLNTPYTARFWMLNNDKNYGQDLLDGMLFFQRRKGTRIDWILPTTNARSSHEITENWSLIEIPFLCTDKNAIYELAIKGNNLGEKKFFIDELLFYDTRLDVYRLDTANNDTILFHNNHRITVPN